MSTAAIIVGVDGTPGSTQAVSWAAEAAVDRGAPLLLVHGLGMSELYRGQVVPPPEHLVIELRNRGHQMLRQARDVAKAAEPRLQLSDDSAESALIGLSGDARMIVLGATGNTRVTAAFGRSVTLALATHATCPVLSVRGDELPDSLPVVVGVDGSALSENAVDTAFAEAAARGTYLVALHAWGTDQTTRVFGEVAAYYDWAPSADSEAEVLAERLAGRREHYPDLDVQHVVVRDDPRTALLDWSHKAQLIVTGSRGRGGFTGLLLGSTSQALLHHAACPVLIARSTH
ncbi:universal stress protein [Amycolatopsis sp. NPDC059021]|uniref:universal stress protein n=1 Tax=Amycolatopsis sp. NPDC059021 TaxID=3346704 RepID=UPI00366DA0B7